MMLIGKRKISAVQSCIDRNQRISMVAAFSATAETAAANQISHGIMFRVVKKKTLQLVKHPDVKSMIAVELTKSDELRSL